MPHPDHEGETPVVVLSIPLQFYKWGFEEGVFPKQLLNDLVEEIAKGDKWPSYNSAHEGYGVLMEEIRELEQHIFAKQSARNINEMRLESLQIAAVALRFARDVCNEETGRK